MKEGPPAVTRSQPGGTGQSRGDYQDDRAPSRSVDAIGERGLRNRRRHGRGRRDDRPLLWLSAIDAGAICGVECGLMIPAMVAAMLLHPSMQAKLGPRMGRG